jgi:hypothetical protein
MKDLRFSRRWLWRILSSGMWGHVAILLTDVSEGSIASIFRVHLPPKRRLTKYIHTVPHPRRRHSSYESTSQSFLTWSKVVTNLSHTNIVFLLALLLDHTNPVNGGFTLEPNESRPNVAYLLSHRNPLHCLSPEPHTSTPQLCLRWDIHGVWAKRIHCQYSHPNYLAIFYIQIIRISLFSRISLTYPLSSIS